MGVAEEPWWLADRVAQFRNFASADGRTAPLYRRFADAAAEDPEVLGLLDAAPGRQQRTVLLFAAFHLLVLADPGSELARFYPSVDPAAAAAASAEGDPWPAFRAFCLDRCAEIEAVIAARNTQTNEVGRCAALVPALELVRRATGQPLSLLEVGASAGLNLCLDRYRIEYSSPTWMPPATAPFRSRGSVGDATSSVVIRTRVFGEHEVPVDADGSVPFIAERIGLDLAPVDVTDEGAVRWLEACVFADRVDRLARLRAAVALARTDPPLVVAGDAVTGLAAAAGTIAGEGPLVVFHSWALTYVDDAEAFAREVAALAADRDVWWLAVEPSTAVPGLTVPQRDDRYTPEMAANTVVSLMHFADGGRAREDRVLARSHPHLDWIHWFEAHDR